MIPLRIGFTVRNFLGVATEAGLRLASHRFDFSRAGTNRHEGWLFDRYPLSVDVDESVGRTEVETRTRPTEGLTMEYLWLKGRSGGFPADRPAPETPIG